MKEIDTRSSGTLSFSANIYFLTRIEKEYNSVVIAKQVQFVVNKFNNRENSLAGFNLIRDSGMFDKKNKWLGN